MRKFNEEEERFLRELVYHVKAVNKHHFQDSFDLFLAKLFRKCNVKASRINPDEKESALYGNSKILNVSVSSKNKMLDNYIVVDKIIGQIMLINTLVDEKLIYFIGGDYNKLSLMDFAIDNDDVCISSMFPPSVLNIIVDCMNKDVYITQDLVEIINNDFVTNEERSICEAKKQTEIAIKTMVVSIVAVFISAITMLISIIK